MAGVVTIVPSAAGVGGNPGCGKPVTVGDIAVVAEGLLTGGSGAVAAGVATDVPVGHGVRAGYGPHGLSGGFSSLRNSSNVQRTVLRAWQTNFLSPAESSTFWMRERATVASAMIRETSRPANARFHTMRTMS